MNAPIVCLQRKKIKKKKKNLCSRTRVSKHFLAKNKGLGHLHYKIWIIIVFVPRARCQLLIFSRQRGKYIMDIKNVMAASDWSMFTLVVYSMLASQAYRDCSCSLLLH
jgi:predicted Na+-dependent transporter